MSCDPPKIPPQEFQNPDLVIPPAAGLTRLVEKAGVPWSPTGTRLCDARTAVRRGLKEYLEQVVLDREGVLFRFKRVLEVHAEFEDKALFPSALIESLGDGSYDAHFTPTIDPKLKLADGRFLVKVGELSADLSIEILGTSAEERAGGFMLLEDALSPVDWRSGFLLELPHYWNARASYCLTSGSVADTDEEAARRWRRGAVLVTVTVPVYRLRTLPLMDPRARVEVDDVPDVEST